MTRFLSLVPTIGMVAFTIVCNTSGTDANFLRVVTLVASALTAGAVFHLSRRGEASPVHKATTGFIILAGLAVWLQPNGAGRIVVQHPTSTLYAVLLAMAAGPALLKREVFTVYFARKITPEAIWQTDAFLTVNRNMTWFWAAIFAVSMLSGLIPQLFDLRHGIPKASFEVVIPIAIMLGIGVPINKHYPIYYQRKHDLPPIDEEGPAGEKERPSSLPKPETAQSCRELLRTMPHGFNTSIAEGLTANYQFDVSGAEDFIAHLRIADGACTYVDGPADRPDIVIRTPADIWLAVAGGKLDGQQAFMSGKYTVVGDMSLLFKLKALFSR